MFLGTYYHTLEEHRRVSIPKAFRQIEENWIVTRGLDGGLYLIPMESFESEMRTLEARTFTKKRNRDFIRLMTNEAQMVSPDANGRIQLPEYLTNRANLRKELVIIGSLNRVEIWDRETYHQYVDTIDARAEEIAEQLLGDAQHEADEK